jgi:hypothetical protein
MTPPSPTESTINCPYSVIRRVATPRNHQVHPRELRLEDRSLLCGERRDLISRDNNRILLLRGPTRSRSPRRPDIDLNGAGTPLAHDLPPFTHDRRPKHIPAAHSAIRAPRADQVGLHRPRDRPDSALPMTAHALVHVAGAEFPEDDGSRIIGGSEELAVWRASEGGQVPSVPSEHTDWVSGGDAPHADGLVRGAGEDIRRIGVEGDDIDIGVVASEDSNAAHFVRDPEAGSLVITAGEEVMAEGTPLDVPHGLVVALVFDHHLPGIKIPQPDGFVVAARQEPLAASVGVVRASSGQHPS